MINYPLLSMRKCVSTALVVGVVAGWGTVTAQTATDLAPLDLRSESSVADEESTLAWNHPAIGGETPHLQYAVARINEDALDAAIGAGADVASLAASKPTLQQAPGTPGMVTATILAADRIMVRWQSPTGSSGVPVSGYQVERRVVDVNMAAFTVILSAEAAHQDTQLIDTAIADATMTAYEYVVTAYNAGNAGTPSTPVRTAPDRLPAAPMVAVTRSGTGVDRVLRVAWLPTAYANPAARPDSWQIYYRLDGADVWVFSGERAGYAVRHALMTVPESGTYEVQVRGVSAAGIGSPGMANITVTFHAPVQATTGIAHTFDNPRVILSGPETVAPGQVARYSLSAMFLQEIGIMTTGHRVSTVAESETVAGRYEQRDCGFTATAIPPVHVCLRLPRGAIGTTYQPIGSSHTATSYKLQGTGTPANHVFEVWISPERASVGQTFEIGFSPTVENNTPRWVNDPAEGSVANRYRFAVTISVPQNQRPQPPRNLHTRFTNGQYTLAWEPPENGPAIGVDAYDIRMRDAADNPLPLVRNHPTTTYTFPDPQPTAPITWQVRAKRGTNVGVYSEPHTLGNLGPPLNLQAQPGHRVVRLTWEPPTTATLATLAEILVTRTTTASIQNSPPEIGRVAATATTYHDNLAENDTNYFYTVHAVDNYGRRSPASNRIAATPSATVPVSRPGPPTELTVESIRRQFALRWQAPASTGRSRVQGYTIQYAIVPNPMADDWNFLIANTRSPVPLYTHRPPTLLDIGTTWQFRIATINSIAAGGDRLNPANRSAWGTAVGGTITPLPTIPIADLVVEIRGDGWTRLHWSAPTDRDTFAVTSYRVERSPAGNPAWEVLATVPEKETETFIFDDRTVESARHIPYTYRVMTTRYDESTDPESNQVITAPNAKLPWLPEFDFTDDANITGGDALTLYYALDVENLTGTSKTMAAIRRTLLGNLTATGTVPSDPDSLDTELLRWLSRTQRWIEHDGVDLGGDLNNTGAIDPDDALILYYTYTFPELLGNDDLYSGFDTMRAGLIGALLGTAEAPAADDQSRAAMAKARDLLNR